MLYFILFLWNFAYWTFQYCWLRFGIITMASVLINCSREHLTVSIKIQINYKKICASQASIYSMKDFGLKVSFKRGNCGTRSHLYGKIYPRKWRVAKSHHVFGFAKTFRTPPNTQMNFPIISFRSLFESERGHDDHNFALESYAWIPSRFSWTLKEYFYHFILFRSVVDIYAIREVLNGLR